MGHALHRAWLGIEVGHDRGGRGLPDRVGHSGHVELLCTFQFGAPPSRTESLFGQAAERGTEVDQRGLVQVEDVGVEVEAVAGRGSTVTNGTALGEDRCLDRRWLRRTRRTGLNYP